MSFWKEIVRAETPNWTSLISPAGYYAFPVQSSRCDRTAGGHLPLFGAKHSSDSKLKAKCALYCWLYRSWPAQSGIWPMRSARPSLLWICCEWIDTTKIILNRLQKTTFDSVFPIKSYRYFFAVKMVHFPTCKTENWWVLLTNFVNFCFSLGHNIRLLP